ncbi:hypothetical protein ACTXT7_003430 [Hymenolepis weldensis]
MQRSNAKYFWRYSPRFNLNLQQLSADDHDIAIIRDLAEPCESYLRAHSLSDLRFDLPGNVIVRQHNNDDNFYSQMVYKYSVICKTLMLPFSLRHSHCHFPKSMHFYLPETWLCTDVDDLRMAIFVKFVNRKSSLARDPIPKPFDYQWSQCYLNSLNPHDTFDHNANVDSSLIKYFPHIPPELDRDDLSNGDLEKYWRQRYRFFALFDSGIHINRETSNLLSYDLSDDEFRQTRPEIIRRDAGTVMSMKSPEGLFSVTPEVLAIHHARRLLRLTPKKESPIALDLFTGVGGNCIQLALAGFKGVVPVVRLSVFCLSSSDFSLLSLTYPSPYSIFQLSAYGIFILLLSLRAYRICFPLVLFVEKTVKVNRAMV